MAEGRQMTRSEYTKREAELEYLKSVRKVPSIREETEIIKKASVILFRNLIVII